MTAATSATANQRAGVTRTRPGRDESGRAPELLAFDHLEWWVGNARHTAHLFAAGFGFDVVAYAGPETDAHDRQSYVLGQGEVRFVVTSPLDGDSEIAEHVRRHGDGIRDVAYRVTDAAEAYDLAVSRGASGVVAPATIVDTHGEVVRSTIAAFGDTVHSFVARDRYRGPFLPGYEPADLAIRVGDPVGLTDHDHVVVNVQAGELERWVDWYQRVLGLHVWQHFDEDAISTEYSALRSTVVGNGGRVVQPINEPVTGRRRSQIQEFLDYYRAPGVQHVAMRTDDIVGTVEAMRERGVRFLQVPDAYYEEARSRLDDLEARIDWPRIAELGVLVDRDRHGHLLQVFTESVGSRPTVFLEIIQREGARGFGEGNFKALFVAVEAEQARRGNL